MLRFLKHLFKLQFLFIISAVLIGIYYNTLRYYLQQETTVPVHFTSNNENTERIFTKAELSAFNGEHNSPLYLAILGSVFDVTRGIKHYGRGSSYNYFVGRDASVSFISGEFEIYDETMADDVLSLNKHEDFLALTKWKDFYNKDYTYVGKVVGRFYNEKGEATTYHHKFLSLVEQANELKAQNEQSRIQFPDCNIEWSKEIGTRVWCSSSSGGKVRNWIGYPRKLYQIGSSNFRCACIKEEDLGSNSVMLNSYENCEPFATECFYRVD